MLETRGDQNKFAAAVADLGCEYALTGDHRVKIVLPDGIEVRDLYRIAARAADADQAIELQARFARRHLPEGNGERSWQFMNTPTGTIPGR